MTEYCQSLLDTIDDLRAENERLRAQCDGTTCVSRETLMVTERDLIAARSRVSALESALREIGERCSRAHVDGIDWLLIDAIAGIARAALEKEGKMKSIPIPNFGKTNNLLWRGGQPGREGFRWLREHKIDIIIKLCTWPEYSDKLESDQASGVVVVTDFKMNPFAELNPDFCTDAQKCSAWIDGYLAKGKKIFVHCHLGKDRTGLVIGHWRKLQGATMKEIRADWKIYGKPFQKYCDCLKGKK